MTASLPMFRYGGTSISLHWTTVACFLALLFGSNTWTTGFWLLAAYFVALAVHEVGHTIAARDHEVRFLELDVYPAGGLTAQTGLPPQPGAQITMSLAGPALNLAVAGTLATVLWLIGLPPWGDSSLLPAFLNHLIVFNAAIGLVNLLPMYPFDGGRALCAYHLRHVDPAEATARAKRTGRSLALLAALAVFLRLLPLEVLPLAALMFYLAGEREQLTKYNLSANRHIVAEAMTDDFAVAKIGDSVSDLVLKMLEGKQKDFPVTAGGKAIGMLGRKELAEAYARDGGIVTTMSEVLDPACPRVSPDEPLAETIELLREHDCSAALVTHRNRLLGIVNWEGIARAIGADSLLGPNPLPIKA